MLHQHTTRVPAPQVMSMTLALAGFEAPVIVADGEEAERAVARRLGRVGLILLDANMASQLLCFGRLLCGHFFFALV